MDSGNCGTRKPGSFFAACQMVSAYCKRVACHCGMRVNCIRPIAACISVRRQLVPNDSCNHLNPGGCWRLYTASYDLPWSLYAHMALNRFLSEVVTMPPSPPVVMILSWQNDQAPTWPKLPTGLPLYKAPCACAQSSITNKL